MIYIPIEIFVREASFAIHLAGILSKCGAPILLGDQRVLQSAVLRDRCHGLYIDKSLDSSKESWFKLLPEKIRLIAQDVEFTGIYRGQNYIEQRFSNAGCDRATFIIFHDIFEANAVKLIRPDIREYPEKGSWYFESVVSTTVRHQLEISSLRQKYGENFIFVPSNFGGFFRREGIRKSNEWLKVHYTDSKYRSEAKAKIIEREYDRLLFADAISKVGIANPGLTIVLRPHPTEDEKAWEAFPFPKNIIISSEYTTAIMTAAASAVLHNGCTTVIDANILGCTQFVLKTSDKQDLWPFWNFVDFIIDLRKPFDGRLPRISSTTPRKIDVGNVSSSLTSWIIDEFRESDGNEISLQALSFALAKGVLLKDSFKYSKRQNNELALRLTAEIPGRKVYKLNRCILIK